MHYIRWKKYNDPLFTKHKESCSFDNCQNKHAYNGFCAKHNKRIERHGDASVITRQEPLVGSLEERFNKSYEIDTKNGCWNWTKSLFKQGYARIDVNVSGKRLAIRAHRFSYELHKGTIAAGMIICHTCDNPKCVNPEHLWAGSHIDNINDCISKGRKSKKYKWNIFGEQHGSSKLKDSEVRLIKKKLSEGELGKNLAKEFNVSKQTISLIKNNKRWKHITG